MTHMVMEIHYDNPKRQENLVDSSGVDFILTDIAPVHEAGMLMLGDPGVLSVGSSLAPAIKGLRIPPNEKQYDYYNTCPSSCTDKQITDDQPLTVVATFAHGHQSAVSLQLDRVLKGKTHFANESDILFSSPHFDFDLQQIKPLPVSQYKTIHKGDTLRMHCKYDTSNKRNVVTVGGEASSQEMCLGFLVYYPRLPSFPMCLGVTARDMPNHASSFAACGVHEKGALYSYPSCGCNGTTCLYSNFSACVEGTYREQSKLSHYTTVYNTTEKLYDNAKRKCQDYKHCTLHESRAGIMKIINSMDGTDLSFSGQGIQLSKQCQLDMSTIMHFAQVLESASTSCTVDANGPLLSCDDQICQKAITNAVNHPCLRQIGTYSMFSVTWPMLYSMMPGAEILINSLSAGSNGLVDTMLRCGICTDSRECPLDEVCQCESMMSDQVACKCVSRKTNNVDSSVPVPTKALFQGLVLHGDTISAAQAELNVVLQGTWSSFCEPVAGTTTSIYEVREFFGVVPATGAQGYQYTSQMYSGHQCTPSTLMSTTTYKGQYTLSSSLSETLPTLPRGTVATGALETKVVFHSIVKTYPADGMCSDSCTSWFLNNGRCDDDGSRCAYGTDCTDCGSRVALEDEDLLHPKPKVCREGSELCLNGVECYYSKWKCDGFCDCTDGSDEFTTAVTGGTCSLGSVTYGGTCKSFAQESDLSETTLRLIFLPSMHVPPTPSTTATMSVPKIQLLLHRDGPGFVLSRVYRNMNSTAKPCQWMGTCDPAVARTTSNFGLFALILCALFAALLLLGVCCRGVWLQQQKQQKQQQTQQRSSPCSTGDSIELAVNRFANDDSASVEKDVFVEAEGEEDVLYM